jgi:polyisoprenoid-binding protein YceI
MKEIIVSLLLFIAITDTLNAQVVKVDNLRSELYWTGRKVTGEHHGTIRLKEGSITLKNNEIVSGKFVIDMTTLNDEDLPAGEWHDRLVNHLKSDDFFDVQAYPEALLVLKGSSPFKDGTAKVSGNLTIKGITNPISFDVVKLDNVFTSSITVDRSLYNVRYRSDKFFDNLGDKIIYDDFTLDVKIVTE